MNWIKKLHVRLLGVRIRCEQCHTVYALGKNALVVPWFAVTMLFSFGTNLGSGSNSQDNKATPDLVRSGTPGSLEASASQELNVAIISNLLLQGGPRWWKCEKCGNVQTY